MNLDEVTHVLQLAAACDRRTVGEADLLAWGSILQGIAVRDASAAVREHYANTNDFLMPADVRRIARRLVRERLEATPVPPPPVEIADDGRASVEWHRARLREIAAGTFVAPDPPVLVRRDVRALASAFRGVDETAGEGEPTDAPVRGVKAPGADVPPSPRVSGSPRGAHSASQGFEEVPS